MKVWFSFTQNHSSQLLPIMLFVKPSTSAVVYKASNMYCAHIHLVLISTFCSFLPLWVALNWISAISCFWSSLLFFKGVAVDSCGSGCCSTWVQAALPLEPWVPVRGEPCMGFEQQQRGMSCYTKWIVVVDQHHVFESSLKAWKIEQKALHNFKQS